MNIKDTFDLINFENSNINEKNKIASKIDNHLKNIGFLIVTNHGIKSNIIKNISLVLNSFLVRIKSLRISLWHHIKDTLMDILSLKVKH